MNILVIVIFIFQIELPVKKLEVVQDKANSDKKNVLNPRGPRVRDMRAHPSFEDVHSEFYSVGTWNFVTSTIFKHRQYERRCAREKSQQSKDKNGV